MKRTMVAAFVILFSTALLAEEPQRYLVATKRSFRSGALNAVIRDARNGVAPRDVAGFETFNGFAASLTSSEVAALRASAEVRWVEPVIERTAFVETRNLDGQTVPYGIEMLHALEAAAGRQTGIINVAVIDTGVDFRHPDLKDVWAGGHNVFNAEVSALDDAGHGTHVAGTIAAADNKFGVVGVAPNVRLWGVKVLNSSGSGTNETVMKGLDWVVAKQKELGGNWVVNMSLGSSRASAAEREAVARATDAGILVVAASGNESNATSKAPISYPAAYPNVVSVGAIDDTATVANFSNQGADLDLSAPGVSVLSTMPLGSSFITAIQHENRKYAGEALAGSAEGKLSGEFVFCGLGNPSEFPASVRGRIALIRRGDLTFARKAKNAVDAGAIGVVVFNNVNSTINWTLRSAELEPWSMTYEFPVVVALSMADGEALLAKKTGTLDIVAQADDYSRLSGTSMATPHVAGAAALVWSMAPRATAAEVAQALVATAVDRGPTGPDPAYGAGVVDVLAAAKHLAPHAFSDSPLMGDIIGKRGPKRRGD